MLIQGFEGGWAYKYFSSQSINQSISIYSKELIITWLNPALIKHRSLTSLKSAYRRLWRWMSISVSVWREIFSMSVRSTIWTIQVLMCKFINLSVAIKHEVSANWVSHNKNYSQRWYNFFASFYYLPPVSDIPVFYWVVRPEQFRWVRWGTSVQGQLSEQVLLF